MLLAKLTLPSLFFHQIILRRNIWRQLTKGLFLPVAAEMLISPQRPGGSWQMPPATVVPVIPRCGVTRAAARTATRQHYALCSKPGDGKRRNICHVFHLTSFHPEPLFLLV